MGQERRRSSVSEQLSQLHDGIKSNQYIWVIAFTSMIAYTPCAGALTSYPVAANYLITQLGASQGHVNTISSIAFGMTVGLCPLSSKLFEIIGYRNVALLGVFGVSISMFLSSFSTQIWQIYLTYSILFGISNNFAYNGLISYVGDKFRDHQKYVASATALFGCGVSLGTMIFSFLGNKIIQANPEQGWKNRSCAHAVCALFAGALFLAITQEKKQVESNEPESHITNSMMNEEPTLEVKMSISRTNLTGAVYWSSNDPNSKTQLRRAFWLWLIGTFIWSSTYTIPYSTANSWPEFQCNSTESSSRLTPHIPVETQPSSRQSCNEGLRSGFLSKAMTLLGLCELLSRMFQVLCGAMIPDRGFASAYALFCTIAALAMSVLINNDSDTMIWIFFTIFPIFTGFLNGFMFGATTDIFTMSRFHEVWPALNVFLALGFALGPVISAYIFRSLYRELCTLSLFLAAAIFFSINTTFKKEDDNKNELRTGSGDTDSAVNVEITEI